MRIDRKRKQTPLRKLGRQVFEGYSQDYEDDIGF